MIRRKLEENIIRNLGDTKAIILLGPRQVGKTTLLSQVLKGNEETIFFNGDDVDTRELLSKSSTPMLKSLIGNAKNIVIDKAQRIENIGICLKIITDNIKTCKVFATGSSAFELANKINEPLTGRKWEYNLYPFSFEELSENSSVFEEMRILEHRLVYGYYPDVVNNPGKEKEILSQLADSYLYKEILTWERIQKPDRLEKLVQALAFQVGNLVSYNELGQMSGLNNETVENYIQLLEKAFVVFRLGTFNRNMRDELKKTRKIYFYDNGLRNAIIKQFNPLGMRNDVGALWENFLVSERMKFNEYNENYCNTYFWRNKAQQEIDYIEEMNGEIYAYEFKWSNKDAKHKFPTKFTESYKPNKTLVINPLNYIDFISK